MIDVIKSFYHRGSLGDIIYSLPSILAYDAKVNLYLRKVYHVKFIRNLLIKQDFIEDVIYRNLMTANAPYINLSGFVEIALKKTSQRLVESHLEACDKMYDFTIPWINNIESNHVADIVINRTLRYHDIEEINWGVIKPFVDRCVFIGFIGEWKRFTKKYKINIKFQEVKDALEIAQIIKGSKFFIGNQSFCFSVAEAMKCPRSLEICEKWDNCQPSGKNGYTYLDQSLMEKYLNL